MRVMHGRDGRMSEEPQDGAFDIRPRAGSAAGLRLAGLPVAELAGLRCTRSAVLAERLLDLRQQVVAESARLVVQLQGVLARNSGTSSGSELLGLKQAVRRVRPLGAGRWNSRVRALLPADLAERVQCWHDATTAAVELEASIERTLTGEAAEATRWLRDAVREPAFRRALWQASPTLSDEVDKWLADPQRTPRRKVQWRLAKYLGRAATKTSPFSSFAVSGLVTWTDEAETALVLSDVRGVTEVGGRLRDSIHRWLAEHPRLESHSVVRVNASAVVRDGSVTFLGRPPAEQVLSVPLLPAVERCLEILAAGPVSASGLRSALPGTGTPASGPDAVSRLLDIGLLERTLPAEAGVTLDELARWIPTDGGEHDGTVRVLLRAAALSADPAPIDDVPGHRARQTALAGALGELGRQLGLAMPDELPARLATPDNVVASRPIGGLPVRSWRPILDDLDVVRRWLGAFGPTLPLRLTMADLWVDCFGAGSSVPFVLAHRGLVEQAGRGGPLGEDFLRRLAPSLGSLAPPDFDDAARRGGRHLDLELLREEALSPFSTPPDTRGVVSVDPAVLVDLTAGWPSWIDFAESVTCYVQEIAARGGPAAVLNEVSRGHGTGRSRVAHLIDRIDRAGGTAAWPGTDSGQIAHAELVGSFGSTLNDRCGSLPWQIEYPFSGPGGTPRRRLPLSDLDVVHDVQVHRLRLVSRRLGAEVRPQHLGLLGMSLLPPAARTLIYGFGDVPVPRPARLPFPDPGPGAGVTRLPRIEVGRVVLRRACWIFDGTDLPRRAPGDRDGDYLLRVTDWRRRHAVPTRSFVRVLTGDPAAAAAAPAAKARKPVYVDFSSWLLVLGFENMLRGEDVLVVVEEALPDPTAADQPARAPRVSELVVEVGGEPC